MRFSNKNTNPNFFFAIIATDLSTITIGIACYLIFNSKENKYHYHNIENRSMQNGFICKHCKGEGIPIHKNVTV